ncbi:MAG: CTP synthase [candidate division TM6 bacterium GW2011_GWF2_30_66]|jgi:CTP synthase|nr:MAG: CTP synthase [candidate division TM6 bacterium GW2011_GWF2_30_66]
MTKYIFVIGGVISGVGKGVATASLGKILKEYGYNTTLIKVDPYLNYDAGTLRPTEHGEVWVTDDGGEIDLDLGTYERFLNTDINKKNNMTSGQVYKSVIDRERSGGYLGKTVQFIPHVPEEIIRRIKLASEGFDIAIIEIGGTVGDYENEPFLFAAKSLECELGTENVAYILVTYLPIPKHVGEMKTKPTQQAIKLLRQEGIFPDFILCRAEQPLDEARKSKIDFNVHISSENIISAPDIETAYEVPVNLQLEGLGQKVLKRLKLQPKKECDLSDWIKLVDNIKNPKNKVKVAVVGKYIKLGDYSVPDSYLSVKEAIVHSGAQLETGVEITWLNADDFVKDPKKLKELSAFDGVIVPGGFGTSGVEGKISAIEYLRTHNIPFLGLCYGMQLAIVEYARHVCGMQGANSTEIDKNTKYPVIDFLPEQKAVVENEQYGGTMRLGVCPAIMKDNSVVLKLYQDVYAGTSRLEADADRFEKLVKEGVCRKLDTKNIVLERHRHRYEVNPEFVDILEKNGLVFSGYYSRQDGTNLMEFIELPDHKFFVATQSHPEFKSRLGNPSPLFYGFLKACLKKDK